MSSSPGPALVQHQAVEAKENVPIQEESRTVATITFQKLEQSSGEADLQSYPNASDRAASLNELLAQLEAIQTTENASATEDQKKPAPTAINRGAPCPCGSGLAFGECHGMLYDDTTDSDRDRFVDSTEPTSLVAE